MILVTTPTGDIGARVLGHLADATRDVRVIVRDPSKLPDDVRRRVEVVEGSHAERAVIEPALDGVRSVFWLPPGDPAEPSAESAYIEFSRSFVDVLPGSGVTHVVGISALGRGWSKPAGHVTASLAMDDMITDTGVHYRALACASLMDNIARQVNPIRNDGVFFAPTPGDLELPHVAKADVATVAAQLLLKADWRGVEEMPLYGPDDISHDEMAKAMSEVVGKPVRFQELSMEQFEGMMASFGASEGMARAYVLMMTGKNEGMDTMTRPVPRENTPTTFQQWCENELRPLVAD